ncbi:MAG TPA: type II toxin-antitoxin system PemK/MazF family toxin [Acidimicrobiales bacterium]|nr:type II toxin-antitoxin system PemK/MazF family toxin [Acidimicrobiales bacterium]
MTAVVRRGEVWLADLDKTRPVIVLTRDPFGRLLHSVIIAPVTYTIRGLSTEVPLGRDDGIRHPSVANLDNVQLVARDRFRRRIGRVQPATMTALCAALSVAVDCNDSISS